MKKKINLIIMFLIILITSGCIENNNKDEYKLSIYIDHIDKVSYHIIIPFLMNENGNANDIILKKLQEEVDNLIIQETQYGIGINISEKQPLKITINGNANVDMLKFGMSLINGSTKYDDGYYWIYSSTLCKIDYEYKIEAGSNEVYFHISDDLKIGWQLIKATQWEHEID